MNYSQGRGRLYPAYSVSGSEGEGSCGSGGCGGGGVSRGQPRSGLSDTPTSENASDATLTDSELALARDSTLLVHNGCLLDGGNGRGPPDVPPRNNIPTMSRHNGRITGNPADLSDFEPSCLVRTSSGNVYIPSGDIQKNSSMDYKSNSSCSSPSKEKGMGGMGGMGEGRCGLAFAGAPVLPVRNNNLRRPLSSHFPPTNNRFHFRKGIASKCSWKCTAIVFIMLSVVLSAVLFYISASNLLNWSYQNTKACSVMVGENPDIFPASKATTLETNRSLTSRPRPAPAAGAGGKAEQTNSSHPLHHRSRRNANLQHDPTSATSGALVPLLAAFRNFTPAVDTPHDQTSTNESRTHVVDQLLDVHGSLDTTRRLHSSNSSIIPAFVKSISTPNTSLIEAIFNISSIASQPPLLNFKQSGNGDTVIKSLVKQYNSSVKLPDNKISSEDTSTIENNTTIPIVYESFPHDSPVLIFKPNFTGLLLPRHLLKKKFPIEITKINSTIVESNRHTKSFSNNTKDVLDDKPSVTTSLTEQTNSSVNNITLPILTENPPNSSPLLVIEPNITHNVQHHIEEPELTHYEQDVLDTMQQDDRSIFTVNNDDTEQFTLKQKLTKDTRPTSNYVKLEIGSSLDKNLLNNDLPRVLLSQMETNSLSNSVAEEPKHSSNVTLDSAKNVAQPGNDSKTNNNTNGYVVANQENNTELQDNKYSTSTNAYADTTKLHEIASIMPVNNTSHVLINLTISTDGNEKNPSKPMYVLSISVPTDTESSNLPEIKINPINPKQSYVKADSTVHTENFQIISKSDTSITEKPMTTTEKVFTTTKVMSDSLWGGECMCSCPVCSDNFNFNNLTDPFYDDYADADNETAGVQDMVLDKSPIIAVEKVQDAETSTASNLTNSEISTSSESYTSTESSTDSTTEENFTSTTNSEPTVSTTDGSESTTTEESYSTDITCPIMTTPLPPPPTILILEGARTFPAKSFPPDGTTFSQIALGQRLSKEILPYSYWNMQFFQSEAAYVKFDYNIPRGASIGVYARRNALPTHTQYHILEVLSGFKARTTRASHPSIKKEVTHYMEQGNWFLSLYNDDGDPQEVAFIATVAEDMTHNCPNGCSGKGECLMGHCQCNPGFGGDDCSESVCPVLCSQKGEYINGECQCNPGWKGKECSLRHDECEVPDCNGHGHCVNGKCACIRGYKGKFCAEADCPHPTCSGHGFCIEGACFCKKGWKGADCVAMDKDALQCLPDCSGHGTFDLDTQSCTCEAQWSGDDCSREVCDLDCGINGFCVGDSCQCNPGWSGNSCSMKLCDSRCSEHGQCKNGTCLCVSGWNGRHCTMEGCPGGCGGHGSCRFNMEGLWECRCFVGWDGPDCNTLKEQNCNDGKDNDKDGLVDCEDPECCTDYVCNSSQLCVMAPTPIEILLRKQPPAITASFFERMKFLIDEDSLQNYARQENFNESRSGVVRGRVVTSMNSGLVGVRVSTTQTLEGFTLTRENGWFELLVNGGGAVTLQFGRAPFKHTSHVVFVPWNEVVIIDKVVMTLNDEKVSSGPPQACLAHDYDVMKPVVLATWKHGFQGGCPDKSAILAESQVVQESLQIPGTGLNLVYHSSRAAGYLSTIQLQLTPETIPPTLNLIHLRITIEGILFEKIFEADPVIKFTYAWNRFNVYRQRIYGVTTAMVKVGYQYTDCKDIIWNYQTTKLSGHDMSISEVGGWNLDIHHRYNFHEGILQKGDGSNIYLKHKPRVILTSMGDGHQRPLECAGTCEGSASKERLLAPVALAASPDGSLFVGDFNLVRRILTDGTVKTVVRLNATRVSYRYHMALSPFDDKLYISDPESHQIIAVRNLKDYTDPEHNWEAIVGSGERCLPGDEAHCGDGALARDAKLAYPKGMAVSTDNILYFADGTNIRMVDRDGIVTTVIGNHMHKSHWKPIPCEGTLNVEEVHLRWPTELAINPLDNTLHIIDDHMILQLTPDGRVKVVAGRPLHCPSPSTGFDIELATHATLIMPQSIAFGPAGDLFVAESDSQRINRVRVIGTDGKISLYAGAESKCNCLERGCDCFEADHYLASSSKFNTISAVVVSPDGVVHIGDQANYRIRSVMASIPDASGSREYEIFSPETQEIYAFNRFGQHIATKNILTGETVYVFTYNVNTSNGKLSTVTDAAGNKVFLLRDYSSQVNSIENTKGQKCRLRMSRMRTLHELSTPDNYNVTFDYHGPTGLLKTKLDSTGRSYVYNYDEFGRLISAVTPTGKIINLTFDLSLKGATVQVTQNNRKPISMLIKGSSVVTKTGDAEHRTMVTTDGSISTILPWGHSISTDTVPYTVLAEIDPLLGESYPVPAKQRTEVGGDLANRFEWRYFLRRSQSGKAKSGKSVAQIGRKLRVNGENLITLEYDRDTASVAVFMDDRIELLNVTYDKTSRPIKWGPRNGIFAGVELEYDRFSRLVSWRWGDLSETYGFDRAGRLFEIKYGDGSSMIYAFKDMFSSLPLKVTTPRGSDYLLQYDDAGALQSLTTPRGHIHAFSLQTSLGFFKYQYFSPMNRHPYEILYNDDGQILSKVFPHQSGKVAYVYDNSGKLETSLAGLSSIQYTYIESSQLVKSIEVIEPNYELKQDFKYHAGILKDEKLKFNSKSGLNNGHYKYQYDGNARLSTIEVNINGKELPPQRLKYNQNFGMLEGISDLRIYRNTFNRSVMQDTSKQFFTITDYDDHGRIKTILINIKAFDVFRLELEYDLRNRVKTQKLMVGRASSTDRITYNNDGHVMEVVGSSDWKYVYDENGNVIGVIQQGEKVSLGYDSGDRVVQYGDVEFNSYDGRGFVVRRGEQKYRYNSRGQLIHAFERDKFQSWYFYDDRGRIVSWKDDKENVTQYFYTNPTTPDSPTHVHYPKTGKTFRFLYDQRNVIITVETSEQRFYVACDQNGSPMALFDTNGNIVKEIKRSPFGKIVTDSNPDFYLPIDFHGGIFDPHTKLVHINRRLYDPSVGQWMTPSWEHLATKLSTPTDIFIYRFQNNDPVNKQQNFTYMTDLTSWLKLYGYDLDKMIGSKYTANMIYQPMATVTSPQLAPDFGVISGLQCINDKINDKFTDLSFVPVPLLKMEPKTRNLLPRVAYRRAVFGEGLLISRSGGRALVSIVEGVNGVVQDVVTSVFNDSHFLDLHFSIHDQDVFYFVKDNALKVRDDTEELRRLGGMFNVTQHEGGEQGIEVRLHGAEAVVVLKYGVDPKQERARLVKHAHKRAVERAWEQEKALVAAGWEGRAPWTEEEKEELIAHGVVDGWSAHDIHSTALFPQLADDPGNVAFVRDGRRKRRKSGRSHRRRS